MSTIFCCNSLQPFRPTRTDHEVKFTSFLKWSKFPTTACVVTPTAGAEKSQSLQDSNWPYAIQLVKQVNYGPLESKRYFVPLDGNAEFKEITERDLIEANFAKVNSYKNFKCVSHNKFFELNIYQKDPVNRHHWRANIARPAADIDLDASSREQELHVMTPKSRVDSQAQIQENTGDESNVASVKLATDFNDSIAGVLAGMPKMGLEEDTEGVSSTGPPGRMPAISSGDKEEGKVVDSDDSDEDYERDDYGYGSYDDEAKDLDYTACSLECGYCGRCDY